jgi:hypothetical protein
MPYEELLAIFQRHILERTAEFGISPERLPSIDCLISSRESDSWLAVPGMHGGFSYRLIEIEGKLVLDVSSWSRIVAGSGKRYRIANHSTELVEEGFI